MNTIKKLAFALLVASATQVCACASVYDPVVEITALAATRLSTTLPDVQPFIQAEFDAAQANARSAIAAEARRMREELDVSDALLSTVRFAFKKDEMAIEKITAAFRVKLKIAVEEALRDVSQVDAVFAILVGAEELKAQEALTELLGDDAITKPSARYKLATVHQAFVEAVRLGMATRA